MPRVGPNYTLPEPPFVPQTSISSAAMNSDLSDIADALTNSLARNGAGGMTAVLPLANDGLTFTNDPDTGIRRSAANTIAIECGNSDIVEISPTGISVTGDVKQNGFSLLPVGLGPLPWSGSTAPAGWVLCYGQTLPRATYAALWEFAQDEIAAGNTLYGNGDGSTTFTIADMRGRLPAGKDNMGGTAANRLTNSTISPNANTLGGSGGQEIVTLTLAQLPTGITSSGTVNVNASGNSMPITPAAGIGSYFIGAQPGGVNVLPASSSGWSQVTTLSGSNSMTSNNTSGAAHPNVQPTIVTNYIIFAGV